MMSNERLAKMCRETVENSFNNTCAKMDDDLFIKYHDYEQWNELVRTEHTKYNALNDIIEDEMKLREKVFSELDKIIDKIIELENELKELMDEIRSYPTEIKHKVSRNLCVQIQILNAFTR